MAVISSLSANQVIDLCFSDLEQLDKFLLTAYKQLSESNGTISTQLAQEKVRIIEDIILKNQLTQLLR